MKPDLRASRVRRGMAAVLAVLTVVVAVSSALVRPDAGQRDAVAFLVVVGIGAIPSVVLLMVVAALPWLVRARSWWAVAAGVAVGVVAEVVLWAQTWLLLATLGVPARLCPIVGGLVVLLFGSPFAFSCLRSLRRVAERAGVS